MNRSIELDELVEQWTLLNDEQGLVFGKGGAGKPGFVLLLKFYIRHGRFPRGRGELPDDALRFVASQVKVLASEIDLYVWSGRTIERHRAQIRQYLGFRASARLRMGAGWVAGFGGPRGGTAARCGARASTCALRAERIEPPTAGRIDRIVRSARRQAEVTLSCRIAARLPASAAARLEALVSGIGEATDDADPVLALVKSDPGSVSLESMLTEIKKLRAVRAIELPTGSFGDVAPKVLVGI